MGKSLMYASGSDSTTANTTEYCSLIGNITFVTSEIQVNIPFQEAGVISNLAIICNANNIAATSNVRLRKNSANGNQIVPITSNTTGYFEDTTHTDTIAAGDKICISHTPGATTGTITFVQISFVFTPTNGAITHCRFANTTAIANNVSENCYHTVSGILQITYATLNVMTQTYLTPKIAGTFKHLALYSSVAGNRANRVDICKNGVDPATSACNLAASTAGLDENTSVAVTVNGSSDTINLLNGTGGGSTSRTTTYIAVSFENTGNYFLLVNGRSDGNSENFGVTRYYHLGGRIINNSTEASTRLRARIPMRLTNLAIRVASNTLNGDVVFTLRKNGVDGNLTKTITAGNSGLFEDTTNNDIIDANDEINLKAVIGGTSGTIIFSLIATLAEYYPVVPPVTGSSNYKDILKQRPQQLITNTI